MDFDIRGLIPRVAGRRTRTSKVLAEDAPMLAPPNAWRILCKATGVAVSRTTFYRWLSSGRIKTVRLGLRIFVPWPVLEKVIKICKAGERI